MVVLSWDCFAEKIVDISILCENDEECRIIKSKLSSLKGLDISNKELKKRLEIVFLNKDIDTHSYKIRKVPGGINITVNVTFFKKIKKIRFIVDDETRVERMKSYLRIQEGGRSYPKLINESKQILRKHFNNEGRFKVTIKHEERPLANGVEVIFKIDVGRIDYVKNVVITSDNKNIASKYSESLYRLKGNPFQKLRVKVLLDDILKNLVKSGYYNSSVSLAKESIPAQESRKRPITLKFNIKFGIQYNFNFRGNKRLTRFELIESIRRYIKASRNNPLENTIRDAIKNKYEGAGIYDSRIEMWLRNVDPTFHRAPMKIFFITIHEGQKLKLKRLVFEGQLRVKVKDIERIYYQNATPLAARDYFDRSYLTKFSKLLKQEYLKRGFLFTTVSDVEIKRRPNTSEMSAYYEIKENVQCVLSKINIKGIPEELENKIKQVMVNKENRPLNIIEIENDLNKALQVVKKEGYFFAELKTLSGKPVVSYLAGNSFAEININFSLGKKSLFDEVIVTGHVHTKSYVIEREVKLKKNEVLTFEKVNLIRERISSLGPFSTVKITPYITNEGEQEKFYKVHLLIRVREKDFGIAEISPGYRTDIGIKVSTLISHNNLWNKNHSFSTKGQINQRLDYNNLDQRRKKEEIDRMEGLIKTSYIWPYFLEMFKLDASLGFQRKRFFCV